MTKLLEMQFREIWFKQYVCCCLNEVMVSWVLLMGPRVQSVPDGGCVFAWECSWLTDWCEEEQASESRGEWEIGGREITWRYRWRQLVNENKSSHPSLDYNGYVWAVDISESSGEKKHFQRTRHSRHICTYCCCI